MTSDYIVSKIIEILHSDTTDSEAIEKIIKIVGEYDYGIKYKCLNGNNIMYKFKNGSSIEVIQPNENVRSNRAEGVINMLYDDICESCAEAGTDTCDYCKLNPYCDLSSPYIEYVRKTGEWFNASRFGAVDEHGEEIVFVEEQCSNCFRWNIRIDRHIPRKYCPHCGAVMEGE